MVQPFSRVTIDYIVQGGGRISWEIDRHFTDPGPYTFQVQIGHTGLSDADDWDDVGAPVIDTYFKIDVEKQLFGKTLDVHYRVQLTTTLGTYISNPQSVEGLLSTRDWLNAREIVRKEILRHHALTSVNGYLLKVRRYGPLCGECSDQFTNEVSKSNCPTCFGTGYELGYFTPLAATYADIGLAEQREHRNPSVGMESKSIITGRFIGDPQLYSYDVWVNGHSDERYYMHTLKVTAQVRGVPIVYDAELRYAPFTDIVYTVPIIGEGSQARVSDKLSSKKVKTWKNKSELNYLEAAINAQKRTKTR